MDQLNTYMEKGVEMIMDYAPKVALALVMIFLGLKFINRISRMAVKGMDKAGLNKNILPFIGSLVGIFLKLLLIFSVAGVVGIDTASFIAVLAAAGFAVGLALQGSLSNFAAGILILIFKPYKVGDWIDVQEKFGKVEEIQIFNTMIITPGQKTLIIPNGQVVENIVTNYSKKGFTRLELNVSMPYEESFPKVRDIIREELKKAPKVVQDLEPEIGIESYDSHNIVLAVRPFVRPDDFWEVTFDVHERIKAAFHRNNIRVAYSEGVEMGKIGE